MKPTRFAVTSAAACLMLTSAAQAAVDTFTSQSAWQAALTAATVIDFDALPAATELASQYAGATFSRFNGGVPLAAAESGPFSLPNLLSIDDPLLGGGGGGVRIDFATPQAGAGFWYCDAQFAGSFVTAYDGANHVLASFELVYPHPTVWQFVGFTSGATDIASLTVSIMASDRVPLDNVMFSASVVPEPATGAMGALGLLGVAFAVRRRGGRPGG